VILLCRIERDNRVDEPPLYCGFTVCIHCLCIASVLQEPSQRTVVQLQRWESRRAKQRLGRCHKCCLSALLSSSLCENWPLRRFPFTLDWSYSYSHVHWSWD